MYPLAGAASWLGERLITGSLQGALVIALAWAACRWIRRVPASVQAWVWWLVALKLALTVVPLPAIPLPLLPAADSGSTPELAVAATDIVGAKPVFQDVRPVEAAAPAAARVVKAAALAASPNWVTVLIVGWLIGVAVHAGMLVRAATSVRRLVRRASPLSGADLAPVSALAIALGLRRIPRVRVSVDVSVPQVVGWRNPVVLLPPDATTRFTSAEWRMAVAHELMHVRRRDVLLGCVPALAERLYFFHPLARMAAREYVTAREAACDAAVVQAIEVPPGDYGRLLVRIGVGRSRSMLVASSAPASASCLKRRLDMLQHLPSKTTSRVLTACVAAAAVVALAPVRLVAVPTQDLPALPAAPPAPPQARPVAPMPTVPPTAGAAALPPAPPAPPAQAAPAARVAAPVAPQPPQAPQPAPAAQAPQPPQPPQAPQRPRSDEVVLRLKSPTTEQEALDTALRVLETQLAQIDDQAAASARLGTKDLDELAQTRKALEELVRMVGAQARSGQNIQQRAMQLNLQMANLNRQREQLVMQQKSLERQIAQTQAEIERMKLESRSAEEAAKKR